MFQEVQADDMLQVLKMCENRLGEDGIHEWWMSGSGVLRSARQAKKIGEFDIECQSVSNEWKQRGRKELLKMLILLAQTDHHGRQKCASCDKKAMATCGGCKTAKFCSQNCLAGTWKSHRTVCRLISGQRVDYEVSLVGIDTHPLLTGGRGMLYMDIDPTCD